MKLMLVELRMYLIVSESDVPYAKAVLASEVAALGFENVYKAICVKRAWGAKEEDITPLPSYSEEGDDAEL